MRGIDNRASTDQPCPPTLRRSTPIQPARLGRSADGVPFAVDPGAAHPSGAAALAQARHVFLAGNGLPGRWAGQTRHVILESGFGLGNNFIATWAAWRRDAQRCERLIYIAVEQHPIDIADRPALLAGHAEPELAAQLLAAWPPATPDLHPIDFEGGRVQLLLALGDLEHVLPGLQAEVDSYFLDSPDSDGAVRSDDVFRRLSRLAAPDARLVAHGRTRPLHAGLTRHGFALDAAAGPVGEGDGHVDGHGERRGAPHGDHPGDRHGSDPGHAITTAHHAPRHRLAAPLGWAWPQTAAREALVIGGGLAGCATAWALARQGWRSTVIDRHAEPAQEASGNAGGLMHAIFNAPDSLHARWFRAAALCTARTARPALAAGAVAGDLGGFLRLEPRLADARAHAQLAAVGLPAEVVDWLDLDTARARSGLPLPAGGWWFGDGGWLEPAGWARWLLAQAGEAATWRGGQAVASLRPPATSGAPWTALDASGQVIAQAPVVVLANAVDALRLLPAGCVPPALSAVRGQVTRLPGALPGMQHPTRPVSGQGYALTLPGGDVLVGATSQAEAPSVDGAALRAEDQRHNLARAATLGVIDADTAQAWTDCLPGLTGRVGWRAVTPDRLPLVGPVLDAAALAALKATGRHRLDAPRHRPRLVGADHGLYLCTGLGSRGITSAALAGQLVAAWISGAPCPVDADLREALDPARQVLAEG